MSLKRDLLCPSCKGRRVWHKEWDGSERPDAIEQFICANCGYFEQYTHEKIKNAPAW